MTSISPIAPFSTTLASCQGSQSAGGDFSAVLAGIGSGASPAAGGTGLIGSLPGLNPLDFTDSSDSTDPLSGLLDGLIQNIQAMLNGTPGSGAPSSATYPFSADFQSAFGSSGPLIDYINVVTAQLHLDQTKNLALQTIALDNKDATYSADSVQKISQELTAAGIG
ncbi:MAG: hypothetical protein KGJ06_03320 [Pseudomonadota bacterium]|nr:hypothetical protein [Pseudomonadota bacterium]